jgi:hypothetical protein
MYSGEDLLAEGFPHSDIRGSTIARISPRLFAACHVLHRLLAPRHPPNALLSLSIHTTARAQGQNTPHAYHSQAAAPASSPRRGQGLPRTMCVTRTHNNSSSSPCERTCTPTPRHPAPSRGSRTTPHRRVSEVSPPRRAAHQAFATAKPQGRRAIACAIPHCAAVPRRSLLYPCRGISLCRKRQKEMETVGFEPTTPCLQSRCSPTELRPRGRGSPTAPQRRHEDIANAMPRRDAVRRGSLLHASGGYFLTPLRGGRKYGPGRT